MRKLLQLLMFTLITLLVTSFFIPEEKSDFVEKWKQVEKFVAKGLPKSALTVVQEIYAQAKAQDNDPQMVKSLIYTISLKSQFEEEHLPMAISLFEKEIQSAKTPEKQLLHSLAGELYLWYYQQNRWKINDRGISLDTEPGDIETWDAVMINRKIRDHYYASLKERDKTSKINLKGFEAIIDVSHEPDYNLWPTLYDLLAHRAVQYFSSADAGLANLGAQKPVNQTELFGPADQFIKLNLSEFDTTSSAYIIIQLYQHLISLHLAQGNTDALIDADLGRLGYVENNTTSTPETKREYIKTLAEMRNQYRTSPVFVRLSESLARKYMELGNGQIGADDDTSRFALVKAEQISREAIQAFPESADVQLCKNLLQIINKKEYELRTENAVYPGKPILARISFKNIDKLYFKIVSLDPGELLQVQNNDKRSRVARYLNNATVKKWFQKLPDPGDHQMHTAEIMVPALESGYYMLFVSENNTFNVENILYKPIWVTRLAYLSISEEDGAALGLYLVDRESGDAIEGVNITAYEKKYNPKKRGNEYLHLMDVKTDQAGYANISLGENIKSSSVSFMLEKDCERLFSESEMYLYHRVNEQKTKPRTYLFTDRAIYRPGQTVYFKGIVTEKSGQEVLPKEGYTSSIDLVNANRKKVASVEFTTNEFGSFEGTFVIPTGGLNGRYTLSTEYGTAAFSVEEYKRPTFEVLFDTIEKAFKLGDEITINGKAENFAGSSVMNAKVTYRVVRSVMIWPFYNRSNYFPYYRQKPVEVANGTVTTDEMGQFSISFVAENNQLTNYRTPIPYQFTVFVEVTDFTGEMQPGSTTLSLGSKDLFIDLGSGDKILREAADGINISVKNIAGKQLNSLLEITLYRISAPEKTYINRYWRQPEFSLIDPDEFQNSFPHLQYKNEDSYEIRGREILSQQSLTVMGQAQLFADEIENMPVGEYLLVAKAPTPSGDTVKAERYFQLFSDNSKHIPGKQLNWVHLSKQKAEPGDILKLALGSSEKKSRMLYEIKNGNELVERRWVTVGKGQRFISVPVLESYRGNFTINVSMIRFNRSYSKTFVVEVPFSNKKLDLSLETTRDFLEPGKREEWKVTVKGPGGEQLAAELMAGMYDASLDQFVSHSWNLDLYHPKRNGESWKASYFSSGWAQKMLQHRPLPVNPEPRYYPGINWFGYQHFSFGPVFKSDVMMQRPGAAESRTNENKPDEVLVVDDDVEREENVGIEPPVTNQEEEELPAGVPRTNFNETAFFYPQLRTDSAGNIVFSFTAPDALTEWKLMMLAHTADFKTGTLVKNIKANKKLMVIPNLPRFLRQGDSFIFTAKVVNFSDEDLSANVELRFFDPVTMKPVHLFETTDQQSQSVNVKVGQSQAVSWKINVPFNLSLVAYELRAVSDDFSDSEQRMIPVVTNRVLVTETLPMPVNPGETKQFSFDDLLISDRIMAMSTRVNHNFSVEFTSNPSWYAIQALPYLNEPKIDNAPALFQKLYANALSSYIVNSSPSISRVFESWREITPETFYSNLQKNQELKNTILKATPWVLEAENEAEQKRRIGILFDLNRIVNEKGTILEKLKSRQLENGAWPWFKGMRADRHTTQNIVLGIGKLANKQIINIKNDQGLKRMMSKAVRYVDAEIKKDYDKLKKNNPEGMKNNHLSATAIEYLYARTLLLDEFPIPSSAKAPFEYYLGQAKKNWLKESNYLQGMIAVTLYYSGYRNEAEGIIRSLKERALHNEEMGMYWRQGNAWSWYEAPVESQAMIIEAFETVVNDPASVEQMKIWLLKQKQTTRWKTSQATAEAVYALLLTGKDLLAENKPVHIKVGSEGLVAGETEGLKTEAGSGYFKKSWSGKKITADMGRIVVDNPNNTIAWGAAYWQYFENLDRVKAHESPLSLEKQLYRRQLTDNGPMMVPLSEGEELTTGDVLIVRLTIHSDRALGYVHLEDMRASALEPVAQMSGYKYGGGLGYYVNQTDVSTDFFIRYLNKGTYILEYPMMVTQRGEFSNGIATIQSLYAPEFAAHSEGKRLVVK